MLISVKDKDMSIMWYFVKVPEGNNGFFCPLGKNSLLPKAEKTIVAQGHLNTMSLLLLVLTSLTGSGHWLTADHHNSCLFGASTFVLIFYV